MEKYRQNANLKRFFYGSGIVLNIGSLVFFKYIDWILESVFQVFHFFNISSSTPALNIILPIGISYYTFQGISYLIQLNRGNESLEKNIIIFTNYFIFFPKFLSGPIELSRKLIRKPSACYILQILKVFRGWLDFFRKVRICESYSEILFQLFLEICWIFLNVFGGFPVMWQQICQVQVVIVVIIRDSGKYIG